MLPYAAYLRIYEPLTAFSGHERSMWASYAASENRVHRMNTLDAEHAQALRRVVAVPPIVTPERESREAYLRRVDGETYVCPWQTRLRSWLAFNRFRSSLPAGLVDAFVPRSVTEQAELDFERWKERQPRLQPHILSSTWQVPIPWFVPFDPAERWLVLDGRPESGSGGPMTAAPTRTLVYVTTMAQARRRTARALSVIRRHAGDEITAPEVEDLGRWLEEFHPHSLLELDYGGLVHLLDNESLRGDQSVAEIAAGLTGLETGEAELAIAMYKRVVERWRGVRALESAN